MYPPLLSSFDVSLHCYSFRHHHHRTMDYCFISVVWRIVSAQLLHINYTLNVMFLLHIPNTFKIVSTMCKQCANNVQTMCKQCVILCAIFYTFSTHLRSCRALVGNRTIHGGKL